MKVTTTKAIVLRRVNYGEADRIITVLTEDLGKISAIAKGVRKLKSKLAGGIEPLAINTLTLIEGKSNLYTLRSSKMDEQFPDVLESLERNDLAFTAIKQINDLVEIGEGSEFYGLLEAHLRALNDGLDLGLAELWWSLRLLSMLGHEPNLTKDANNNSLSEDTNYLFNPEEGSLSPTELDHDDVFTAEKIKLWRLALQLEPMKLAQIMHAEKITQTNQVLKLFVANHI